MPGKAGNDPAAFKSSSRLLWAGGRTGDHLVPKALLHLLCQTSAHACFTPMNCLQTQAKNKEAKDDADIPDASRSLLMKQHYQECFQSEAEALGLIFSC